MYLTEKNVVSSDKDQTRTTGSVQMQQTGHLKVDSKTISHSSLKWNQGEKETKWENELHASCSAGNRKTENGLETKNQPPTKYQF